MRIFVHGVNTYVGRALVQELRKTEGGCHRVFGTALGDRTGVPVTVKRLVSRDDPKKSKKMIETIQSCRLVVVDLFNCTLDDLHFIIGALKVDSRASPPRPTGELEIDVTFVLVSSLMVWAETTIEVPPEELLTFTPVVETPPPAVEDEEGKEGEGEGEDEEAEKPPEEDEAASPPAASPDEGEEEEDPDAEPAPPVMKRPAGLIRDSDFRSRAPLAGTRYESWKDMEELVMASFNRGEDSKVKAFVLAAGIFYGCGEETLAHLFKDAWLGDLKPLPAGTGENHVPTVHVRDLARLVRSVGFDTELDPMEQPYFIGVDQPPAADDPAQFGFPKPPTQAQLLQGIIDELSGPPVKNDSPGQPGSKVGTVLGTEDRPPTVITESSALQSMRRSTKDKFSETRGKPIELGEAMTMNLWVQPSAKMVSESFAEDCDPAGWISQAGLVSNIRSVVAEFTADRKLQAMRVIISGPPLSGKSTLAASIAEHFNIPHLDLGARPMEDCIAALGSKVCHYRGYVLECQGQGWPDMDVLFRFDQEVEPDEDEEEEEEPPPPDEDDEEGEERPEPEPKPKPTVRKLNEGVCPTFAIILQSPEPFCRARWQAAQRGSKDDFAKVYEQYAEANLTDGVDCVSDFFQEVAQIPVLNLPIVGKDQEDIFESARIYMERAGRPFNYLKPGAEVAKEILAKRVAREEEEKQRAAEEGDLAQQKEGEARQGESARQAQRMKVIEQHELQRKVIEGLPLRDFLMKFAVPNLTEGLIETCKVLPEDPVDYLANYLEKCAERAGATETQ